ncbi:MAG TPA: RDD family protein [Ferruginibacter sp.]|nr:RDD family protein [Ferruginibacter sp.]
MESNNRVTLARPSTRYIACLVDYAILMGVTNLLYLASRHNVWIIILFVPMWFFYFPFAESNGGQTLAKRWFKLKVQRYDGGAVNLFDTFARHLLDILDFLPVLGIVGFVLASQQNRHQRLGDRLAKTEVIQIS